MDGLRLTPRECERGSFEKNRLVRGRHESTVRCILGNRFCLAALLSSFKLVSTAFKQM